MELDTLEPGEAVVAEPVDGVELTFHGLADESAGAMMVEAVVENEEGLLEGIYLYDIVDVDEEAGRFVAEADRHSHTKAEEAIEEAGGTIQN